MDMQSDANRPQRGPSVEPVCIELTAPVPTRGSGVHSNDGDDLTAGWRGHAPTPAWIVAAVARSK